MGPCCALRSVLRQDPIPPKYTRPTRDGALLRAEVSAAAEPPSAERKRPTRDRAASCDPQLTHSQSPFSCGNRDCGQRDYEDIDGIGFLCFLCVATNEPDNSGHHNINTVFAKLQVITQRRFGRRVLSGFQRRMCSHPVRDELRWQSPYLRHSTVSSD